MILVDALIVHWVAVNVAVSLLIKLIDHVPPRDQAGRDKRIASGGDQQARRQGQ